MDPQWTFECRVHDLLTGPFPGRFDAAYALDVIEHIGREQEDRFVGNIVQSLDAHGVLILGTPSLQSQAYASPPSKAGHVNCKDAKGLKDLIQRFFHQVFVFSMNDEVVHTGYFPMAHYLFAIGCTPRRDQSLQTMDAAIAPLASLAVSLGRDLAGSANIQKDSAIIDLTIVVPCLNEEHNIIPTLETVESAMAGATPMLLRSDCGR